MAVAAPAAPAVPVAAHSHPGETRAIIGLIVAILSVPGAIIPILGLVLAITGLVLGSLSIRFKRVLAILALVFAGLGLVLSILAWAYNVQHRDGKTPAISSAGNETSDVMAPAVPTIPATMPATTRKMLSPGESTSPLLRLRGRGGVREGWRPSAAFEMTDACELRHSVALASPVVCPPHEDRRPEGDS